MFRSRRVPRRRRNLLARLEAMEPRTLLNGSGWDTKFDFGTSTSPVESGHIQVLPKVYSRKDGFGWQSTLGIVAVDRLSADPLTRDFHSGADRTFLVDVPNGTYDVMPTMGDSSAARDLISIWLEGQLVDSNLSTQAGQFVTPTYRIQVNDGQLSLRLKDQGGVNTTFALNGLQIDQLVPPSVHAGPDQTAEEGGTILFQATASGDGPFSYAWDFGDGSTASGTLTPTHIYADNGLYTATLTVTDAQGLATSDSVIVHVDHVAPTATITGPSSGAVEEVLVFDATATDPGLLDQASGFLFEWDFGDGMVEQGASVTHSYVDAGSYLVRLRVTDKDGAWSDTSHAISIQSSSNTPPMLVPTGDQTTQEGSELTFTVVGYDFDVPAQTLSYSLVGPPAGATIDPVTGLFSWTPSESQGPGSYVFGLQVSDGDLIDLETIMVTVAEVNVAPVLAALSNRSVAEGSLMSFTASATDADLPAQALTYSLVSAPSGAAINATTGAFTWTPTEAQGPGTYTITVRVSDGTLTDQKSFTATVTEANVAPVLAALSNRSVAEGSLMSFTASATDADLPAQALTYSLVSAPSGAAINATTGAFTWTPTEAQGPGTYTITVRVSDGTLTDQKSFTATVTEANVAPVLAALSNRSVAEGSLMSFTASATDADLPAQALTYSLVSAPSGAAINATTGAFTWTPTEAQGPGTYTITVRVSDGTLTDQKSFTATVTEANVAPVLAALSNRSVAEGSLMSFTASATDADLPAQALTYSLVSAPSGAAINATTGAFTWTPTEAQGPGTYTITVRVSDGTLTDQKSFTATVVEANVAPVLAALSNRSVAEGSLMSFTASATDADLPAQALTYSLVSAPTGAAINATTGAFTWTPTEAQGPGTYTITVRVSDGTLTDQKSFTATVTEANVAPVLAALSNRSVAEGSLMSFTASATDADLPAQALTYSLVSAPSGAAINATTGAFTWTPTEAQGPGTYTITVRVSDGSMSDQKSFTATVTEVNVAPVLNSIANQVVTVGALLTFTATATDADIPTQTLTYSLVNAPAGATIHPSTGVFSWTPTADQSGQFSCTVRVSDGLANDDKPVQITVNVNNPPVGNIVNIDQAWLTARGAGPYLLDQADTTYMLQTDVTVEGTAFIVLNKNVTFDLNGHTVTYGNSAPITVPNGGFEDGSSPTDIPGWTFSDPSVVSRQPARVGMWGNWMLRLSNISTAQTLTSEPIAIPVANVEYAAAITPKGYATVTLNVVDTVTGAILKTANSSNADRGFSAVAQFTPTTTNPVRLQVIVTPATGKTTTVDLDYASLHRSRDYGIVATQERSSLPTHLRTILPGYTISNVTVRNGSLLQGTGKSTAGSSIYLRSTVQSRVDSMTLSVTGMDANIIEAPYAADMSVSNNNFLGQLDRLSNRMAITAAVYLGAVSGTISVTSNTISGTGLVGINLNAPTATRVIVSENVIRHDALGTDGYGIRVSAVRNFEISGNTIQPVNGRGMLFDGLGTSSTENGLIAGNIVEARERPNLEYSGSAMEATALRVRNYSGARFRNLIFRNNTFFAETGIGLVWAATGARIGMDNSTGLMNDAGLQFQNNVFRAVLNSIDPSYTGARLPRAWGLTMTEAAAGTGTTFVGNHFESNDVSLNFGDNDGYNGIVEDYTFVANTFTRLEQGVILNHRSIVLGDWYNTTRNVRLIDNRFENGATTQIHFTGSKVKDIATGWLLDLTVTNADGSVLAGATVNLFDRENGIVFNGTTDANGRIRGIRVVTTIYRQTTTNPTVIMTDPRGLFTIEVVSGSSRKSQTLDMTGNTDLTISL